MNKKIIKFVFASLVVLSTGCKDDFLEDKRDLGGVNEEVFKDPVLAQAYVDYIYGLFLPSNNGTGFIANNTSSDNGTYNNIWAQTSDELAGQTDFNRVWASISNINNHANKYFGTRMSASVNNNTWTRMKQINLFLSEVDKYGLSDEVKNKLKGQLHFWRAWQYFELVRMYGGVPLVLEAQNPSMANKDENSIPRSKTSETIEQICKDLDIAMSLLPGKWPNPTTDWGRITSGAAAALKGRVLLTWASPIFNPNDDVARWERAYTANLEAKTLLESNGSGLFKAGGAANGKAWGDMWFTEVANPEAVIVFGFNNLSKGNDFTKNSGWEQAIRPREINGAGSISPTKQIVDLFPMLDGKSITDNSSAYAYDANKFYKNRDPRFYKTFAYNGAIWGYAGNLNQKVWTYSWKKSATAAYTSTETKGANASGIYLNKASNLTASNSINNFEQSGTDFMELRFAEVILNLAECAIGKNSLSEGLEGIKAIRERAGLENKDGHFGLADAVGNRNKLFKALLNERAVEFAYEGKRFYDLRRWMLFDDAAGWNTKLGIPVLNGTRRTGYRIVIKNAGSEYVGATDPLLKPSSGNAPVIDRDPGTYPAGITSYEAYVDYLYDNYFKVEVKDDLDLTNPSNWSFTWYPEYYYFGIHQNLLDASPYLIQTKGWNSITGNDGFDPLL